MNKLIVKKITYPAYDLLSGRNAIRIAKELEQTQWLSDHEIKAIQLKKIKNLIEHAYKSVPYYRKLFDKNGINPHKINDFRDFKTIPLLTKEAIRKNVEEMVSKKIPPKSMKASSTSGSSGQPMDFVVCNERLSYNYAFVLRGREWIGVDSFDKKIWLWGRRRKISKLKLMLNTFRDRMLNKKIFYCDYMDEAMVHEFIEELKSYNPKYLYCYAGAIYYVAKYLKENGITGDQFGIKAIITTSETLFEHQRTLIENVFNCKVGIEYGSADGGIVAQECNKGRLHIHAEGVYVENEDNRLDGQAELVITNLHSFGMPFIRYKIGDIGYLSNKKCSCGRNLPVIEKLIGRTSESLWALGNRRIDPLFLDTLAEEEGVLRFRIHQYDYKNIRLDLEINENYNRGFENWYHKKLKNLFGYDVTVSYNYLDEIPPAKSGKHRYITSDLNG